MKQRYRLLLNTTNRWWGRPSQAKPSQAKPSQAKRFSAEIAEDVKRETSAVKQLALGDLRAQLDEMLPLVRRAMERQAAP